MRVEDQPGWILHARPYRETSLLLECFSRDHGRVGLVARGVRRERAGLARATLQALAPLSFAWLGRGELGTLMAAEARGQPLALQGEGLLCALYLNELVMRLVPRNDAFGDLFERYELAMPQLHLSSSRAWTLRQFERDLLGEIGYGIVCEHEADSGEHIVAEDEYLYVPEHGAVRYRGQSGVLRLRGSALLALAEDTEPDAADLASLRRLMRALITHQLGGATLRSWEMLAASSRPGRVE